jgi:universal stress protein A
MYSRILVPTDFSKASVAAFKPAAAIASHFGSSLFLIHVAEELPLFAYRIGVTEKELRERVTERAAAEMRKIARRLPVKPDELLVRIGNVQQELLRVVKERKIDLIVMGTHGRTGLAHAVVGSTAEKIVRLAPCQVLTVKPR